MKLRISTLRNWYRRTMIYGLRNAVTLMINQRKSGVYRFRYRGNNLWLRGNSVDFFVFDSIFRRGEYDFDTGFNPEYIVDAGAFTGLSSVWFHERFPGAMIIAIEPEESNFKMLVRNTGSNDSIIPVMGAIYGESITLAISNPSAEKYAFRVAEDSSDGRQISGFTIIELMRKFQLPRIDILKMDIEGAEYSVFTNDPASWLNYVGCLVIELHEYIHPGVTGLVIQALKASNFTISHRGENLVAIRAAWDKPDHSITE